MIHDLSGIGQFLEGLMKPEEFSQRLWDFAARVGKAADALPDTRLGRHVAGQLVRSGTSPAPNYDEGRSAESRDDFTHKLSVATKEMRETLGWLGFIVKAELLPAPKVASLVGECEQLLKMLARSVHTAKARQDIQPSALAASNQRSAINNPQSSIATTFFRCLDHIALIVADTDDALRFYRDTLGLPLLFSEVLEDQAVRLTHLDLGNTALQLVQPLRPAHPLNDFLKERGEGLHHLCFNVENVPDAMEALRKQGLPARDETPRRGPRGKQAAFLDPTKTRGVLLEMTAPQRT